MIAGWLVARKSVYIKKIGMYFQIGMFKSSKEQIGMKKIMLVRAKKLLKEENCKMKKTIFKALAATAVVGAVIAMSGVVASAAETKWLADDGTGTFAEPDAVFGFKFSETPTIAKADAKKVNAKAAFADAIFADGTGSIPDKGGIDINAQHDIVAFSKAAGENGDDTVLGISKSMSFAPQKTGIVKLYVAVDNSANKTDDLRIYSTSDPDPANNNKRQRSSSTTRVSIEVYSTQVAENTAIQPIILPVKGNEVYSIYANSGNTILYGATFTDITEATTSFKEDAGKYYIVSVVTPDQAANATSLTQKRVISNVDLDTTGTVYKKVNIGGVDLDATAFDGGTADDYLYATEVSTTADDKVTAEDVQGSVTRFVLSVLE